MRMALLLLLLCIAGLLLLLLGEQAHGLRLFLYGTFSDGLVDQFGQRMEQWTTNGNYKSLTTILPLAIEHFNARNESIISNMKELLAECPSTKITTVRYVDDANAEQVALEELVNVLALRTSRGPVIVDGIVGPLRSSLAQPVSSAANALNIPVVSHWSTATSLSNKKSYPLFARTTPTDEGVAVAMADLFEQFGYKRIGLIYLDDPFGNAWKNALHHACERNHNIRLLTVLFDETEEGVDNAVQYMKDEAINIIIYIFIGDETLRYFANAAEKHDMLAGRLWVSALSSLGRAESYHGEMRSKIDKFLSGSLHVIATLPGLVDIPGIASEQNEYWENLRRVWPTLDENLISDYFPGPYRLEPRYFATELERQIFPVWAWAFDAILAYGLAACECNTRGLSDGCSSDSFTLNGKELFKTIVRNSFQGVSGRVAFLENGDRDPTTSAYILKNVKPGPGGLVLAPVGKWTSNENGAGSWTLLHDELYLGADGSKTPPPDTNIPFHRIELLPAWAKALGYVEFAIVLLAALWCLGFTYVHRTNAIIVAAQPYFLCISAFGCAVMGASIVPLTMLDSASCMTFPWLFGVGFTIALSAWGVKSWRVYYLWNHPGFLKSGKGRKGVFYLGLVGLIVIVEIGLLVAWTVVAPLKFVIVTTLESEKGFPLYSHGTCLGSFPNSAIFLGLLLFLNALVLLGTVRIIDLVRRTPNRFHEVSHQSFVGACCVVGVYFVGIPTVAALYSHSIGRFVGLSSIAFLTSISMLIALYLPRVNAIRAERPSQVGSNGSTSDGGKGTPEKRFIDQANLSSSQLLFQPGKPLLHIHESANILTRVKAILDHETFYLPQPQHGTYKDEQPDSDSNKETEMGTGDTEQYLSPQPHPKRQEEMYVVIV